MFSTEKLTSAEKMSTNENKAIVRHMFVELDRGNLGIIGRLGGGEGRRDVRHGVSCGSNPG